MRREQEQKLPIFNSIWRGRCCAWVRLHIEEPTVSSEQMLRIDNAAGFPDARGHGLSISSGGVQTNDRRGRVVVLEIVAPDQAVTVLVGHRSAAKAGPIFADHHEVFPDVDVVRIEGDIAAS